MLLSNNYRIFKTSNLPLVVCLFFLWHSVNAQNLIQNPSFESYVTPNHWYSWDGSFYDYSVFPAKKILNNWEPLNSPDYFLSASSSTYTGVPNNKFGEQYAKDGGAYIGLSTFQSDGTNYREYAYQQFTTPLLSNHTYSLSFWVSRADKIPLAVKQIGAYFCATIPPLAGTNQYINAIPQIENTSNFITDTVGWTQIKGCYIALGGEKFIILGNFRNKLQTDTIRAGSNNLILNGDGLSYYYLDDVSLTDITATPKVKLNYTDSTICKGDSLLIGVLQPLAEAAYQWQTLGNVFAQTAAVWLKPSVTQTYVVQQTLCSVVSYDTLHITIKDSVLCIKTVTTVPTPTLTPNDSINELIIPNVLTPNGDGINDYFKLKNVKENTLVTIYNRWGNEVFSATNYQNNFPTNTISDGVYYYIIKEPDGQIHKGYVSVFR